jgi:hypothetical protein
LIAAARHSAIPLPAGLSKEVEQTQGGQQAPLRLLTRDDVWWLLCINEFRCAVIQYDLRQLLDVQVVNG